MTTAQPPHVFTATVADIIQLRMVQVEQHGHTPERDDATGPERLANMARQTMMMVSDMLIGDPSKYSPHERSVLRKRLLRSITLLIAATDALDRLPVAGETGDAA